MANALKQVVQEIDALIELIDVGGENMGPRNADRALDYISQVQAYLKTKGAKPYYDLTGTTARQGIEGALARRGLRRV
jgi:hypothetical protein